MQDGGFVTFQVGVIAISIQVERQMLVDVYYVLWCHLDVSLSLHEYGGA